MILDIFCLLSRFILHLQQKQKQNKKVMVRKLRLKSGEVPVERIIMKKTKHKIIKAKIKMRRNISKVRRVKIEKLETRSCVNEKIQNKRGIRWW